MTPKPCRCGEIPVMRRIVTKLFGPVVSVSCPVCHSATTWCDTESEAISKWNEMQEKPKKHTPVT